MKQTAWVIVWQRGIWVYFRVRVKMMANVLSHVTWLPLGVGERQRRIVLYEALFYVQVRLKKLVLISDF